MKTATIFVVADKCPSAAFVREAEAQEHTENCRAHGITCSSHEITLYGQAEPPPVLPALVTYESMRHEHRERAIDLLVRGSRFLHESWCDEVRLLLIDMGVPPGKR